jgi:quinol monooxygenase YgiN
MQMSEQTLTVLARVKAQAEKLQHVEQTLTGLIGPTREEPGCISYTLHQSNDDPCVFVFVEIWRSQADLDEHLQKPYLQAFIAAADELLAEPLDVTLWHEIQP